LDVFNLNAKLSLDTDDYERQLNDASGKTTSFWDVFSGTFLGNAVFDGLKAVGSTIVSVGKSAAGAALDIGKASLSSYADYEQLVGGVETLYKDSAGIIEGYAKDAYKNVGLSANEYMETSTSFAAALVSSLGGDTQKAAEMANTAISDMSDNANKMGTNISSIQDAYNGFAKQNYTMLDNLKLGYGGTQAEMKRLIKEAAAMKDTQAELGVTVDATSMSYANIVQAIHVVQANMDIMGTTSKEAATTIQGSTASMKSAWENLLTGIADPEQDVQQLINNFVDSLLTAAQNILPRIQEIVPTLINAMTEIGAQLAPVVSTVIESMMPTVVEGIEALFNGLSFLADELQPIIEELFSFFGDAIVNALTSAIENSDFSVIFDIFDEVKEAVNEVIPVIEALSPAIGAVGTAIAGWQIGTKIQKMVTAFDEAKVAVSLFSMGLSDSEVAQGALDGTLKGSEVVVGLLTGKIDLLSLAQGKLKAAQAALNAVMAANPIAIKGIKGYNWNSEALFDSECCLAEISINTNPEKEIASVELQGYQNDEWGYILAATAEEVSWIVGIEKSTADNSEIKIYPNPVRKGNSLTVETTDAKTIRLMTLQGVTISNQNINTPITTIQTDNLTTGTYLLIISGKDYTKTMKIIVK